MLTIFQYLGWVSMHIIMCAIQLGPGLNFFLNPPPSTSEALHIFLALLFCNGIVILAML